MLEKWQARQALLLGEEKMALLAEKCVAVIGLGGVGGACAEGLCRAGIGKMILMDHDEVDETNINRQMIATHDTIGMPKTEACAQRLLSINPRLELVKLQMFYGADTAGQLFEQHPDYIIDCIDTVTAKLDLAARCQQSGIPLLMSLGTGNRLDPTSFRIGKIEETASCGAGDGLARVMRRETRKRGLTAFDVLYSTEPPAKAVVAGDGRYAPGSIAFCPPVAGLIEAGFVVRKLAGLDNKRKG